MRFSQMIGFMSRPPRRRHHLNATCWVADAEIETEKDGDSDVTGNPLPGTRNEPKRRRIQLPHNRQRRPFIVPERVSPKPSFEGVTSEAQLRMQFAPRQDIEQPGNLRNYMD